jgi:DNA-binding MarR family transcriptional regulator
MIPSTPSRLVAEWWRRARPDLDTAPMDLFGRLRRLQIIIDLDADSVLRGTHLTSPELDVLVILRHADQPLIARSVADLRACSRAAMTNILNKLESRGLITREANLADRRASLIRLSEEGAQLVDEIFPRRLAIEAELLSQLSPAQQEAIIEALDLLLATMLRGALLDGVPGAP